MLSKSTWPGRAIFLRFIDRTVLTMPMGVCGTSFVTSSISAAPASKIHDGSSRPTTLRDNPAKTNRNAKVDIFAHCYRNANPQRHCTRLFPRVGIRVRQMDRTLSNQQPQPYFYLSVHRFLLR